MYDDRSKHATLKHQYNVERVSHSFKDNECYEKGLEGGNVSVVPFIAKFRNTIWELRKTFD